MDGYDFGIKDFHGTYAGNGRDYQRYALVSRQGWERDGTRPSVSEARWLSRREWQTQSEAPRSRRRSLSTEERNLNPKPRNTACPTLDGSFVSVRAGTSATPTSGQFTSARSLQPARSPSQSSTGTPHSGARRASLQIISPSRCTMRRSGNTGLQFPNPLHLEMEYTPPGGAILPSFASRRRKSGPPPTPSSCRFCRKDLRRISCLCD